MKAIGESQVVDELAVPPQEARILPAADHLPRVLGHGYLALSTRPIFLITTASFSASFRHQALNSSASW